MSGQHRPEHPVILGRWCSSTRPILFKSSFQSSWSTSFTSSYFPESGGLWTDKGLPACQALAESLWAEELNGGRQRYEHLDPRQLLKHSLGLFTQLGSRFSLCYLYYDWPGKKAEAHRREIGVFNELVGEEIRVNALTYQKVFAGLMDSGQVGAEYKDYLRTRYLGEMV